MRQRSVRSLVRSPVRSLVTSLSLLALGLPLASAAPANEHEHAHAAHATQSAISVVDPYVRLVPPAAEATGAFMVLRNDSDASRRLLRADSPAAKTVELHKHIDDNGVMRMRKVDAIDIPAQGETTLKPGSYHVMLIGLKAPLQEGDRLPLTLNFDDGSQQKIEATVRSIATTLAPEHAHGAMKH
jgi:copper(I)-binding protein